MTPRDTTEDTPMPDEPQRNATPLIIAAVVAIAIIGGLVVGLALTAGSDGESSAIEPGPSGVTGTPAPEVAFEYWESGEEGTVADFEGTPLVVNFFASWCAPCVSEMPDFQVVSQEFGDEVQFLGVNFQDSREAGEEIVDRTGVTYLLASDNGDLLNAFEGLSMPTTAFITADGQLVRVHSGALTAEALTTAINETLLS
jgi:thiol-disulfide isomerase/thioredoxin